jgi:hypothetical protein
MDEFLLVMIAISDRDGARYAVLVTYYWTLTRHPFNEGTSCVSCFRFRPRLALLRTERTSVLTVILRCNTSWIVRISCTPL